MRWLRQSERQAPRDFASSVIRWVGAAWTWAFDSGRDGSTVVCAALEGSKVDPNARGKGSRGKASATDVEDVFGMM